MYKEDKNPPPSIYWAEGWNAWVCVDAALFSWKLQNLGWVWHADKKWFFTKDDQACWEVRDHVVPRDIPLLDGKLKARERNLRLSLAAQGPVSLDPALYDFQNIAPLEIANRNILLADEMGLGKTVQAIWAINVIKPSNVLVVVPNSMVMKWHEEISKWLDPEIKTVTKIYICPWSRVIKLDLGVTWDMAIVDEAHYAKNPDSKRSQAFSKIKAARRVALTGTPILGRPTEIFPIVQWLEPYLLGTREQFEKEYCARVLRYVQTKGRRRGYWDYVGAKNVGSLQKKLRETVMIARVKRDVLTQLPPKTRSIIELSVTRDIIKLESQIMSLWEEAQRRTNDIELWNNIFQLRKECALLKVPMINSVIDDIWGETHITGGTEGSNGIESREKRPIIIWAHHHEVSDAIRSHCGAFEDCRVEVLDGRVKPEDRHSLVAEFQDGKIDILIAALSVAGVGVTLTRSDIAIFAELDWTPANMIQAEDRLHRIGQEKNVSIFYCIAPDSLDGRFAEILTDKQRVINAFTDISTIKEGEINVG